MNCFSESASKLFLRDRETQSFLPLEEKLFPSLSNDVVEISGESGSGKTELLYHLIATSILPPSWKGSKLGGLKKQVFFIDNDCHFNLFRLITILENRIKSYLTVSRTSVPRDEQVSFIQDVLKLLFIVKCYDTDEYIMTLHSFDNILCMQRDKSVVMIDGISSFYWSDKARFQNLPKLISHYKSIAELIFKISKSYCASVIVTRRKLMNLVHNDEKAFGQFWNSGVKWKLKLENKGSLPDRTNVDVLDCMNSITKHCSITNSGFSILD